MKKVLGILVGLLAVGVLVGVAVAMPPWLHGNVYGFAMPGAMLPGAMFSFMHDKAPVKGYSGYALGYSHGHHGFGAFGPGAKFVHACQMWGYPWETPWKFNEPQQNTEFDEIKEKIKEILKNSEVKNGYIVKDSIVYGFLYENVSLSEVEPGEPFVMMWFTAVPLEKDGKVVGFLRVSNFELFKDSTSTA